MTEPLPLENFATQEAQEPATDSSELYACIDVGTNTVKMVIADLADGWARLVFEQSVNSRLGEGMQAQARRLREVPMRRTLDALAEFVQSARRYAVRGLVAVGTAALREGENRDDFLRRAQEQCDLRVEVISGDEEARLSYLAVRRDPRWRAFPRLLVIDVGGGSTEVIQGEPRGSGIAARRSVGLGAVKLTEGYLRSDPPTIAQLDEANRAAAQAFAQVPLVSGENAVPLANALEIPSIDILSGDTPSMDTPPGALEAFRIVGVGGTVSNLGAMAKGETVLPETLHGYTLTADDLERQIALLATLTVEQRKALPGLDPRRADIILGGAILLSLALARVGSATIDVSTRGLRWGVLYDRFLRAPLSETFLKRS